MKRKAVGSWPRFVGWLILVPVSNVEVTGAGTPSPVLLDIISAFVSLF